MEYTEEQLAEARRIVASENGKKHGNSWWLKLSESERQERIRHMNAARLANIERKRLDKTSVDS